MPAGSTSRDQVLAGTSALPEGRALLPFSFSQRIWCKTSCISKFCEPLGCRSTLRSGIDEHAPNKCAASILLCGEVVGLVKINLLLVKWQKKGTVLYRLGLCHLATLEQRCLSRFHNKLLQMFASIPASSWAKQGWQVGCKVFCKLFWMVLLQLEEGRKPGWLPVLRYSFPQGIFPPQQMCFSLPGVPWEHSDPASDKVDSLTILPGGLLFGTQSQSRDLSHDRASQMKGRADVTQ